MSWEVKVGDVRRILRELEPGSFDACLSDPPYGISFGGQKWDVQVPSVNVWTEVLRVLRPGAFTILFNATRTYHRMAVNVEDAGFEICDMLAWMYGSGFPKSLDIAKEIDKREGHWRGRTGKKRTMPNSFGQDYTRTPKGDPVTTDARRWSGYGTALKPAIEPCILACKPHPGTIVEACLREGTGALNLEPCRIGDEKRFVGPAGKDSGKRVTTMSPNSNPGYKGHWVIGFWPSNVIFEHAESCTDEMCDVTCPAAIVDRQQPGASKIFFCSKPGRAERDRGLEDFPTIAKGPDALRDGKRAVSAFNDARYVPQGAKNDHKTVKPISVTTYFATLLLPPPRQDGKPRRILVPFSGSGSEMIGCLKAGWDEVVGIELDPNHAQKARARIAKGKIFR